MIRKLPPLLVNQIAAGEVIERPASVVKELIENSLDAGATRIDVAVEDGGQRLIRIADDGGGIPPDELPLALTAHATSKLASAEGLAAIETLGFRGEALASVASVSRLRLASRTRDADAGHVVEQAGDDFTAARPHAMSLGTVIEVRDLFFNTPARRRFMRAAATEYGHIADTLGRVAMVHPRVGFALSHNGRATLDLPPGQDRRQRCVALLGKELDEALLEVESEGFVTAHERHAPPTLWALVGEPSLARGSAKFQYLCVNGRPVKDRNLGHAVKEAFRGLIAPDRYPVAAVFVTIDPHEVDVNVHPTKAEVRFRNPSAVHGLVLSHLRQRLLGADLTPVVGVGDRGSGIGMNGRHPNTLPPAGSEREAAATPTSPSAFVDFFKRMDPTQKGFVYDEVRREMSETEMFADAAPPGGPVPGPRSPAPSAIQFKNSYVVTQDDEGLLIVDQHALHERVMFEELRRRVLLDGKNLESQRLLMPAVVEADASRQAVVAELSPLLTRLGIDAEPMGPSAVAVHAFPSLLFDRRVEPAAFVNDLLDHAEAGELSPTSLHTAGGAGDGEAEASGVTMQDAEAALHTVLDMMSCKAAVKAGDPLSADELTALLAKRQEIERSSSCPHGRPTTVRLTVKDLERHFHRT